MNESIQQPQVARDSQAIILVVDDEPAICWGFEKMLTGEGHRVVTASSAEEGLQLAEQQTPTVVLLDVRLPGQDGISALPAFHTATRGAPIIVMTAFGDLDTAVGAVQNGACDYLTKPFRLEDALQTCRKALRLAAQASQPSPGKQPKRAAPAGALIGRSAAMQQAFRQIALVADSELSVLITGETGTGKELVAAAIHRHSSRSSGVYLPIAPVALNENLIESELFGHQRGAFTGAGEDRAGLFEQAEGGTILLDEIGELPISTQAKLLRVLESGQYARVGDVTLRESNVRVLAATNCDLHDAVQQGAFREDLYYRLNGLHIHLPPLRERCEDIPLLCEHFLNDLNYPNPTSAVDEELLADLRQRDWYGNVRELRNAVEHAAVVARGRPLNIADFPKPQAPMADAASPNSAADPLLPDVSGAVSNWTAIQIADADEPMTDLHERLLHAVEPALLAQVLKHTQGNRAKAAEILGIHRGTLRERLRNYGLDGGQTAD